MGVPLRSSITNLERGLPRALDVAFPPSEDSALLARWQPVLLGVRAPPCQFLEVSHSPRASDADRHGLRSPAKYLYCKICTAKEGKIVQMHCVDRPHVYKLVISVTR